ncbi:MAG: Histidinol-phosphate aminotransferase [bacterium]|nr:Histidinol-phosphate aminotransferase [bacterium]
MSQPCKSPYLRRSLAGFAAYTPGEQPPSSDRLVKLNTNENPYPPSPKVIEAMRGFDPDALRRYPDPTFTALRQAAGNLLGVPPEWVIAGNGSDELLAMVLRAFVDPGEVVAYPVPTYSLYPVLAEIEGARVCECPAPMGGPKIEAVLEVPAKVTFVATPNAPDGYLVSAEEIARLCAARRGNGVVVADEAYVDFSDGGAVGLVGEFENLLVTRTLSKSFSLAGLRLGIAVGQPSLLEPLWAVKDSYNLGALPQALATAALQDAEWMCANARKIVTTRERTSEDLRKRGWRVYPSHANFIFAEPPGGNARDLYAALAERGVFVRYFSTPPLVGGLRISIGSPEQMGRLLEEIDSITPE